MNISSISDKIKDISKITLIDYIKRKYANIIFTPSSTVCVDRNLGMHVIKTMSLGFIISEDKILNKYFVIGYISNNGKLCKLIQSIKLTHANYLEIIDKLPIVNGYSEEYKNNLIKIVNNQPSISKNEHYNIITEFNSLLSSKKSEYNILVNTDQINTDKVNNTDQINTDKVNNTDQINTDKVNNTDQINTNKVNNTDQINIDYILLIKKEYETQLHEIKEKYDNDIFNLREEIRKSDESKDLCRTRLLNEKDIIINSIKDFKNIVSEYIYQIYNNHSGVDNVDEHSVNKNVTSNDKVFKLYKKLMNEKLEIENNMNILLQREKEHLSEISDDKNIISDYVGKLNLKSTEIIDLNNTIKDIQKELYKIKDQFSHVELEKIALVEFKKTCIELILHEKQNIIDKIKDYNLEWLKWIENNNVNVQMQKEKLRDNLNTIYINLKKVIDYKDEYINSLNLSSKEKEQLISQLMSNMSDIKLNIKYVLNEQIIELSKKNQELEFKILDNTKDNFELIKEKDDIIKDLKLKLDNVKNLLEKNNSVENKIVDYDNCYNILHKFISVNNMFFRKKDIINILDDVISSKSSFTNLNEDMQNNIKSKYNKIKLEINKHIDFLDLNKYINSPNIDLFKNKDTIKDIPSKFCDELTIISEYWDANIELFKEQDNKLTNIYEDLSGSIRIYIKIRPSIEDKKAVHVEGKKVIVNCLDKNESYKKTFGDFYSVFDETFSNKDIYTGIKDKTNLRDLKINTYEMSNSSGLFNTFKQIEDGYSIVLFSYGDSGSGKSMSLLGQNDIPGIIHYGLANLKDVQQIKLKYLFEQYINKFTPTLNTISGKIINLINEVPQMRKYSVDETKQFSDHLSSTVNINTNKLKIDDINKITDSVEKYRVAHSRIKKTPNNHVSSRSHLYIVFEIVFKNGKVGYITLVDTAGKENPVDIYNLFIQPQNDKNKVTLTTILGPSGGPNVILQNMKEEYKEKYDAKEIYEILKEGVYINETLNHLSYFFNKKNYKQTKIIGQVSLEKYNSSRYYVNPSDIPINKFKNTGEENSINPLNNCLMIPILKFLDNISNRKQIVDDFKPTKFNVILCIRNEESHCIQIVDSLEFGQRITSS